MAEVKNKTGCNICGGITVVIRGKYPGSAKRIVCPTCLQETIDKIRNMTHPDYGKGGAAPSEANE